MESLNFCSAFIINPMDLKLHRMILDGSLHECNPSGFFDFRSSDPEIMSKIKISICCSAVIIKPSHLKFVGRLHDCSIYDFEFQSCDP